MSATPRRSAENGDSTPTIVHVHPALTCCDASWEAAYLRFESREQEIAKFQQRLLRLGATGWSRNAQIVELLCGHGSALCAWEQLGYTRLDGVDLSESLLQQYRGPATLYVCDARELPFAGHPTIGAAVQLALDAADGNHNKHEMMLVLEEEIGPIRCGVSLKGNAAGHVIFDLPKMPATTVDPADRDLVAAGLGLAPTDIGFENHVPTGYDAGVPYCFVPVRDLDAIARARPEMPHYDRAFGDDVLADVFVYTRETVGAEHHFHARMFAPKAGIPEDPATGSGVAGLAGVIARFDQPPGGSHRYLIEQGYEMGRPSLIGLEIDMHDGAVHGGRISGDAVVVAEGTLSI